jgi:transcription elongation factor GreA
MNKLPMTAVGHSALENELKHRIRTERPRLIQRIQEAIADDSNLAENSEYQAAKAEQEINEARIVELDDKLARAEIVDLSKLSGDTIKFGATVTLIEEDTGKKKTWQIVGEPEADASKGKISVTSPIAERVESPATQLQAGELVSLNYGGGSSRPAPQVVLVAGCSPFQSSSVGGRPGKAQILFSGKHSVPLFSTGQYAVSVAYPS